MKSIRYNRAIAINTVFVCFCALLWWLGPYNFVYLEHLNTFYFAKYEIVNNIELPGGLCKVISNFLIQFFRYPVVGVLVTAALLTAVTTVTARRLYKLSWCNAIMPLAALPAISLAFLHYNINYMYSCTVAMLLMLIAMSYVGYSSFSDIRQRLIYALVATFVLYATSGAVALLYGVTVFIIILFRKPKEAPLFLLCPLLALIQGFMSVYAGVVCDMQHAVLPAAYFTHRLEPTDFLWMPWILFTALIIIAGLYGLVKDKSKRSKRIIFAVSAVISVAYAVIGGLYLVNSQNEDFKQLNYYLREQRWDDAIDKAYSTKSLDNLLLQNCLNLALAEDSQLADRLFDHPCYDIRSIYITGDSKPYIYMLLSDIYYSMGHISLAQRHAFEALEALENRSPRMLQRLALTNIIYGNYTVARKYLDKLSNTLFYKDWADDMRSKLSDEGVAGDPVLAAKRACLFPDDRFAASRGLDDDLRQVIANAPQHPATAQYLGSLYLLSKDMPRFMEAIQLMEDTGTLPMPMPRAYAEGIVAAGANMPAAQADSIYTRYLIDPSVIKQFEDFKSNPSQNKNTLWYFLKYIK